METQGQPPVDYVVDLFEDHDVVFLGEQHRVKHDPLLVQSLLEPLHEAGVNVLATEFGRREDQPLIDSLLQLPRWDEELARRIVFQMYPLWGYREYVDVYRAAWEVNHGAGQDGQAFEVLGINDSPEWSHVQTEEDRSDSKVLRKVWEDSGEDLWAEVILDAVAEGKKALVYCGIHHGFTEYRQPVVVDGEFVRFDPNKRCGNYVYDALGKRAITVYLHAPWRGAEGYGAAMRHPAGGVIDTLMLYMGPRPVGFDVSAGPLAALEVRNAVYKHGYDSLRLGDFCDGWIYTKPISEYEGVTPIEAWVNEDNLERAQSQSPAPAFRDATAEEINRSIAWYAGIQRQWGHLR